jgi:hypothetical protein
MNQIVAVRVRRRYRPTACAGLTGQKGTDLTPNTSRGGVVMESFDGTMTSGRKGIAYDWQSLLVEAVAATLDFELATMTPEYAE